MIEKIFLKFVRDKQIYFQSVIIFFASFINYNFRSIRIYINENNDFCAGGDSTEMRRRVPLRSSSEPRKSCSTLQARFTLELE